MRKAKPEERTSHADAVLAFSGIVAHNVPLAVAKTLKYPMRQ